MRRTAPVCLFMLFAAAIAARPSTAQSSSEKVRDNPAGQYVLMKTVVGKTIGTVDARAEPVEVEGYNLLKYCWTAANVLGDWSERAGLAGQMAVAALETLSWQRDLARAGYPAQPVAQATGRYEATLVSASFTAAARQRALDALAGELEAVRRTTPGATRIRTAQRCQEQVRSLGLKVVTMPEGGRARFIPYLLHELCRAQQLDADDPVRCDYWLEGRTDPPIAFAGETVYSVRWPDGAKTAGRFDPDVSRSAGTVTLRPPPKPK